MIHGVNEDIRASSMQQPAFAPGLRFSLIDGIVVLISVVATLLLSMMTWWWGFIVGFTVLHFYLFCNVFRISRPLELFWSGLFVALAGLTITTASPGWVITIVISLIVTAFIIGIEMKKPSYHGVGWQKINQSLQDWWNSHLKTTA